MRKRLVPKANETRVSSVAFEACRLLTVDVPDDESAHEHGTSTKFLGSLRGAIVRVRPGFLASAGATQALRKEMLKFGARAVRILPVRKPAVVVAKAESDPVVDARQAAARIVADANTRDRAALMAAVEAALSAAGV